MRTDNQDGLLNVLQIRIPAVHRCLHMHVKALAGLLLIPVFGSSQVLDPPALRCASVNVAGDVTLNWTVPADPNGDFDHYEIYQAPSLGGPFGPAFTVNVYGQTSQLLLGAGADSGPQYFYIVTVSSGPPPNASVPSDTLSSLYLQVTQSIPLGSAVLDWTPQHVPPLTTAGSSYSIWMEYPIGAWQQVGQVSNTTFHYEHVISICEDSLTFRVGLGNALGCTSFSSRDGDVFADVTPPSSPIMVNVSVDTLTNMATLDWGASPEGDTDAYIILLTNGSSSTILDTIYGQNNTTYTYLLSQAADMAESFTVAAFDTCWSGMPPSPNTSPTLASHSTVHVSTEYDRCGGDITVQWTPYAGWEVQAYQVFAQEGGGAVYLLGTFNANQFSTVQHGVAPFTTYCYVVKALKQGGGTSSLSNKQCQITDYPPVPLWNYIRTATVLADDHIQVVDSVDLSAVARRYRLERSTNGGSWTQIATRSGGSVNTGSFVFDDHDVQANERSYSYRVIVDDSCGTQSAISDTATTILLRAQADLEGFNELQWNGYRDWAGQVSGYTIYRSIGDDPLTPIAVNAAGEWTFTDDVRDLTMTNGRFCYYVEANEVGNPSGIDAASRSNSVCAVQQEEFWLPNAFIIGGANNTFKPVTAYTDLRAYEFIIYNRWGQEIWSTNDPGEAWKGTVRGSYVPQGVYAYYCAFENGAGRHFEKRGTVTCLWGRPD
ncbi:MAG: gliding motility-associated C-terminal domain-containing protein [Flavobacteriales bacterium]|nr:gliding motility-associated C-terminal domain-containing protein [Flavobacteriales bacterium]MCB9193600.1 gliding motility-associated C-terminal domain-containing protein [Flavobacteriales bacterium]